MKSLHLQFGSTFSSNAPHIGQRKFAQYFFDVFRPMHIATALQLGILFAKFGSNFGQGLGGSNAYRHRNGRQFAASARNFFGIGVEVDIGRHGAQIEKGFVDGVDFDGGGIVFQNPAYALRHIAVKSHVAREYCHLMLLYQMLDFEIRIAHFDA